MQDHVVQQCIPAPFTSILGREQDIANISSLLQCAHIRLLTLFGTGGIGKTRLALCVASEMRTHFADGVYVVLLAGISAPQLLLPTLAEALNLRESGEQSLLAQLKAALQYKHALLLLDNMEQIVSAAQQLEELLQACPLLKVLVTSREVLRVQGEHVFPVLPLALPDLHHLPSSEDLSRYTAIALFTQRARAIVPTFQLTPLNASAIAEICVRLDGLPLAIELAAARSKLLSPQNLLARLSQRLHILTGGSPSLLPRQQTLRNTLQWSYNLLQASEQRLFRQLAVFVGGWTLEAAEALWKMDNSTLEETSPALDGISSLLDKSLLLQIASEGEEPRFTMLETVRAFGLTCLHENGEAQAAMHAHALYFLNWAEQAEPYLKGARQSEELARLEQEQENLRAALQCLLENEESELADRLCAALGWFWHINGHWSEGRHWLEAARICSGRASLDQVFSSGQVFSSCHILPSDYVPPQTPLTAKLLRCAGDLASCQGDYTVARTLLEQSVALSRDLADKVGLTLSLSMLSAIIADNDVDASRALGVESVRLAKEVGDLWNLAFSLYLLALAEAAPGNNASAIAHLQQSVVLFRQLGDKRQLILALSQFGIIMASEGHLMQAAALCQESLSLARVLGSQPKLVRSLYDLAKVLRRQRNYEQAVALLQEGLVLVRALGDRCLLAMILHELGCLAQAQDQPPQATALLQESIVLYREMHETFLLASALCDLAAVALSQHNLHEANTYYNESLVLAQRIGHKEAIAWNLIGLAHVARADSHLLRSPAHPFGLTSREFEVLRLVATGLTNGQIAEQLIVSPLTINTHVRSIYHKLGITSRCAATRFALEHQLT